MLLYVEMLQILLLTLDNGTVLDLGGRHLEDWCLLKKRYFERLNRVLKRLDWEWWRREVLAGDQGGIYIRGGQPCFGSQCD
jgi:hypothetical protein